MEVGMKIAEFILEWDKNTSGSTFIKYNLQTLLQRGVSKELSSLLSEYGLPESAAPYLNFENIKDMSFLFDEYYYLGFTGNGDWICLNSKNGKILIVDHEIYGDAEGDDDESDDDENYNDESSEDTYEDEDFEGICLLNSSLEKLYDCLLAYRLFVQERLSEDVKKDCGKYEKCIAQLEKSITEIDKKAMEGESFWAMEISSLYEDK